MTYYVFSGTLNPAQSNPVIDGTDWTESKLLPRLAGRDRAGTSHFRPIGPGFSGPGRVLGQTLSSHCVLNSIYDPPRCLFPVNFNLI